MSKSRDNERVMGGVDELTKSLEKAGIEPTEKMEEEPAVQQAISPDDLEEAFERHRSLPVIDHPTGGIWPKHFERRLRGVIEILLENEDTLESLFADKTWFAPIGTIWQFDATGWVDNSSIPGWYACIAANAGVGCPDMVDSFVMGKVVAGAGSTGGVNTQNYGTKAHTHTMGTHYHAVDLVNQGSGLESQGHYHGQRVGSSSGGGYIKAYQVDGNSTHATTSVSTTIRDRQHNHTHNHASRNTTTVDPGDTNSTGSDTTFDNRPAWYSMIFIRKCA